MQIVIPLFDRFTSLDAVGPYEILARLPGAEITFVAERTGPVHNDVGSLALSADATFADVPAPDLVLVPGGPGQRDQMTDGPLRAWLRAADATSTWTTSVCTGSLLLAGAGLLTGRRATTHWLAYDRLTALGAVATAERVVFDGKIVTALGAVATAERVVFDGKYVTAAGVSAGIDMALTLAGRIAGDDVAQRIQLLTEYDPQPPYDAGSPDKAPRELVDAYRSPQPAG